MRRKWWRALALALLLVGLLPGVALAHPEVLRTEPALNSQLDAPPARLRVYYSEAIEQAFAALQLFNAQGQRVDQGGGGRSAEDPAILELAELPPLAPGLYTAVWQIVGSDGHLVKGYFSFTVRDLSSTPLPAVTANPAGTALPSPSPAPAIPAFIPELELPEPVAQPPASLAPLLRALMLLGAIGAIGGAFVMALLLPLLPLERAQLRALVRTRWHVNSWLFLGLLLIGAINFLFVQTLSITGRALSLDSLGTFLLDTQLGQALLIRLILSVVLVGLLATRVPFVRWRAALALLVGALLLLTFSLGGHAAADARPLLPVLIDWLHLLATTAWVGGLLLLALTLPSALRELTSQERAGLLTRVIQRFSTLALICVALLAATGAYAGFQRLGALSDLWTSGYGRALLVKLVGFGGLILLGAYNMLVVRQRFSAWTERAAEALVVGSWQQRFRWAVRAEVALALLAIGAAGVLTNSPPPRLQAREATAQPSAQPTPTQPAPTATRTPTASPSPSPTPIPLFEGTQTVADLEIKLRVDPARIGQNQLEATLRTQDGAPYSAQKVSFMVKMPAIDLGETRLEAAAAGEGGYRADEQILLTIAGEWEITVEIFRLDADDMKVVFKVPVRE